MLPAALHAFIMACLARVFARLEQIFLLWQSGQLALAPIRPARNATQHPLSTSSSRNPAPAAHRNPQRRPSLREATPVINRHHSAPPIHAA